MFSNFLKNAYEQCQTPTGGLPKSGIQQLFYKKFNYILPRQSLAILEKYNIIKVGEALNSSEKNGKRFAYNIESVKDALVYLLVCDSIVGMSRGGKDNSKLKHFNELKIASNMSNIGVELQIKVFDKYNGVDINNKFYDPMQSPKTGLDTQQQTNVALIFFMHWINGVYSGNNNYNFCFYKEWQLFKRRVLELNEDRTKEGITLFNKHHQKLSFNDKTLLKTISYSETTTSTTIDTSIAEINRFLGNADDYSKLKLQTWFEILLRYDTGADWLRAEAKAELEKLDLDFSLIINDLWLLAFIFYHELLKNSKK